MTHRTSACWALNPLWILFRTDGTTPFGEAAQIVRFFWVPNHGVWILMSWVQMNLSPVECELAKEWRSQLHYLKQMVFKLLEGMFLSSPHA